MLVVHNEHPCPADYPAYDAIQAFISSQASALDAGHYAVITLFQSDVVGHNFYALSPVVVAPGVTFDPGGEHFYSYGAATVKAHRGKRLSPARWTFFRDWRYSRNLSHPTIAYIALDNLASLASGTSADSEVIGFSAWRRGAKRWSYRSPAARRRGVGFKVLVS